MTKNWKKFTAEKEINFWIKKTTFYLSLSLLKDVQVTEEAFSSVSGSGIRIPTDPYPDPLT
jgi:hypothetical protein